MEHISKILKGVVTAQQSLKPASGDLEESQSEGEKVCPLCRGVQFVHPRLATGAPDYSRLVPCKCALEDLEDRRRQWLLRQCALPVGSEHMTFENFRLRPGLKEAYEAALAVAEGDSGWLTLISDTNRGKTHLAIAICRRWLEKGNPARYIYVPLLLDELRAGYENEGNESYAAKMDFFLNVPLLVMDDLGVENLNKWAKEKLDTIVDYRLMNKLALVVTTNTRIEELPFRIASRLDRQGKIVVVSAKQDYTSWSKRKVERD